MPVFITGLSGKSILGKVADKSVIEISTSDMYGATAVKAGIFADCTDLQKMGIPNSVVSIDFGAFDGCDNLIDMKIPFAGAVLDGSTDTHFGYIFGATSSADNPSYVPESLKTVTITNSTKIASNAFLSCSHLTSVVVLDSVARIGQSAFRGCTHLNSITLPFVGGGTTTYADAHFGYIFGAPSASENPSFVPSSLKNVVIKGGETIENQAFSGCSGLKHIILSDTITSIGNNSFHSCSGLIDVATGDGVTTIGNYAFYGCGNLKAITMSTGLTTLGTYAFYGCSSLVNIIIPHGVTAIGERTFDECNSLATITLSNSVASIGNYAFRNCRALESVVFNGTISEWGDISKGTNWKYNVPSSCKVHCTDGDIDI